MWVTAAKAPWSTVGWTIGNDIKRHGKKSRFVKTAPGVFAVRAPSDLFPELATQSCPEGTTRPAPKSSNGYMSFLDAAEYVLRQNRGVRMHYRDLTNRALALGLIQTKGKTPEATMLAQIGTDIRRRAERGEPQRFVNEGGMIGLAEELPVGIADQIGVHNKKARAELLRRAKEGTPHEFEELVERLLVAMGFEDVEKTSMSQDGGIDVRGTLVIGDVVRIRMAVQAKRWESNVPAPVVQRVRGSLGAHEQGLIITTSDFSGTACKEAARTDASPVALMNGKQLSVLLARHQIGAERQGHVLLVLDPPESRNNQADSSR